jgi:hypothetical protein
MATLALPMFVDVAPPPLDVAESLPDDNPMTAWKLGPYRNTSSVGAVDYQRRLQHTVNEHLWELMPRFQPGIQLVVLGGSEACQLTHTAAFQIHPLESIRAQLKTQLTIWNDLICAGQSLHMTTPTVTSCRDFVSFEVVVSLSFRYRFEMHPKAPATPPRVGKLDYLPQTFYWNDKERDRCF